MLTLKRARTQPAARSFSPIEVAKAYNFPAIKDASKRRIALLELGGGYSRFDLQLYCKQLGITPPVMNWYGVDGAVCSLLPDPTGADGEVQLDQCMVAAICPGINIDTYFAPNTDQGFEDDIAAVVAAIKTRNTDALSISWGAPEDQWDPASLAKMDILFQECLAAGIGVYVAAGDNGSSDGESSGTHVDYPASSPWVTACGGTRLLVNPDGTRNYEKVWSLADGNGSTGGGYSTTYTAPPFQRLFLKRTTMRSVPDVAGNADPVSGYNIKVDFMDQVVGGTSAVAPLYAALHAILQSYCAKPLGDLRPLFYQHPECFFDVVDGSNGDYSATTGFDQCTGLGVIDGTKFLKVLIAAGLAAA